jgi:hypothetical protein
MASKKLTPIQSELNEILMENGYKTFTASKYEENELAQEVMKKYLDESSISSIHFLLYIRKHLRLRKSKTANTDMFTKIEVYAVMKLFEINDVSLAKKVSDFYYENAMNIDEQAQIIFDDELQEKINELSSYCKSVNNAYRQYKEDEAIWSSSPAAKRTYKQSIYNDAKKAINKNNESIQVYVQILKDDYSLNQRTKVKADKLLSYNLPNINSLAIARKIIQSSNLFL